MRAVVQRVNLSSVIVEGAVVGSIKAGLNVLLGVEEGDGIQDVTYMAEKIVNLRIFEDEDEKMNLSVLDIKGQLPLIHLGMHGQ